MSETHRFARRVQPETGVKVLGERNSGTSFLERSLSENYDLPVFRNPRNSEFTVPDISRRFLGIRIDHSAIDTAYFSQMAYDKVPSAGGWKHAAPDQRLLDEFFLPTNAAAIMIVRHPATWLQSMFKRTFNRFTKEPKTFGEFLRFPWLTIPADGLHGKYVLSGPVSLYAHKARQMQWLFDTYPNSTILRYEDFTQSPKEALANLGIDKLQDKEFVSFKRDARTFLEKKSGDRDYVAEAKAASYDSLNDEDRAFVISELKGSPLLHLYPA